MFDKFKDWRERKKDESTTGKNTRAIDYLTEEVKANEKTLMMCIDTIRVLSNEISKHQTNWLEAKKQIDKNSKDIINNGNKIELSAYDDSDMFKKIEELRTQILTHSHRTALGPTTRADVEELHEEYASD